MAASPKLVVHAVLAGRRRLPTWIAPGSSSTVHLSSRAVTAHPVIPSVPTTCSMADQARRYSMYRRHHIAGSPLAVFNIRAVIQALLSSPGCCATARTGQLRRSDLSHSPIPTWYLRNPTWYFGNPTCALKNATCRIYLNTTSHLFKYHVGLIKYHVVLIKYHVYGRTGKAI